MAINLKKIRFIHLLRFIHLGLIMGLLIFVLVTTLIHKNRLFFSVETNKNYLYFALLVSIIGNWASKTMYKKILSKLTLTSNFNDKILKYTNAYIYKLAFLMFAALVCILLVYKFYNSFYLILVIILGVIMLAAYPSKDKITTDVPFSSKEKSML